MWGTGCGGRSRLNAADFRSELLGPSVAFCEAAPAFLPGCWRIAAGVRLKEIAAGVEVQGIGSAENFHAGMGLNLGDQRR